MQNAAIVASRLSVAKPSASVAAKAKADALRAEGRQIVDFTVGEPDFPTPPHIVHAGRQALLEGHTRYTASAGILPLRKAIQAKLQRENRLAYELSEIVVGCGAKHIIFNAFTASLNEGDEVVIPAPYWVSYPEMVRINAGVPRIVDCPADVGFKLTPEALEAAITPRTRWVVLNSPNNPTGAVYSEPELRALGQVLARHPHVWVMTDEIYEHFVFDGARHACLLNTTPELKSRTLVINGLSKAYAMTGWRVGYGAAPVALIQAIALLIGQSTTCATASAQIAAAVALDGPQGCVQSASELFAARRTRMATRLNAIDGIECDMPAGAFYVFASVAGLIGKRTPDGKVLDTDLDVCNYLIDAAGVVTIDGASYGLSPYLRFSFATSDKEIDRGIAAIAAAVDRLKNA
ncbi:MULTISPECIES: aminotransferase class I/II-fold pyridoxal phosphate-dependent enzyme [unclassified Variovorax]|uniref:aminotransferase class I/II-fold pyridoxal phosphate-dependent enzyme n=1 Tax=unclassified Variovorax TaxID=663243 RepID=UPI002576A20C|nr:MULTISPECIES: aminotransferase class I/II-fold pyridoxal phosphate-dependent enzyme [unclassified Variovorax]MDM0089257.1 aminotransferase class I/II-fold pyridoxal phosphate-dependent enzyme [Variovorax sp. J22G40]MDM0147330.1 aminotransferase class I/II-fold pyridoxal phosphate-dependent enzyme [Variovorax sp. J2P1-31]